MSLIHTLSRLRSGIGGPSDAAATGDGSVIAILKRIRALSVPLAGQAATPTVNRSGSLAAGADDDFFDVAGPIVIDSLVIGSKTPSLALQVFARSSSGSVSGAQVLRYVSLGDNTYHDGAPKISDIADGGFPPFEVARWDPDGDGVLVRIARPIYWPNGGRIRLRNSTASTIYCSAVVSYRTLP